MLIFRECYYPPRRSCFSLNNNKSRKPESNRDALRMMALGFYSAGSGASDRTERFPLVTTAAGCGYFCGHFLLAFFFSIRWNFNFHAAAPVLLIFCYKILFSLLILFHLVFVRLTGASRASGYNSQQLFSKMINLKPYCETPEGKIHTLWYEACFILQLPHCSTVFASLLRTLWTNVRSEDTCPINNTTDGGDTWWYNKTSVIPSEWNKLQH